MQKTMIANFSGMKVTPGKGVVLTFEVLASEMKNMYMGDIAQLQAGMVEMTIDPYVPPLCNDEDID